MEETEVVSTTKILEEQEESQVETSPNNVKEVESEQGKSPGEEKIIKDTEVVCTSQELEDKVKTDAVGTQEASEDSFSEGSIHIRVSEPFSLTGDLDLYLSDGSSDDKTENEIDNQTGSSVTEQIKEILPEQEEFFDENILSQENSVTSTDLDPGIPDIVAVKRRGRPPGSKKKVNNNKSQNEIETPKRRGRPRGSKKTNYIVCNNKSLNKIEPQQNFELLQKSVSSANELGKITKTEIVSQVSDVSLSLDEKQENINIATQEQSYSTNNNIKRNTNILSAKDLIDRTLSKLIGGNSRTKLNPVSKGEEIENKGKHIVSESQNINVHDEVKKNNSPNEICKKEFNGGKQNKSQSVTVITPRELINRTLEKLTHRKFDQVRENTDEKKNSKSGEVKSPHTNPNKFLEGNSKVGVLSSEKKEALKRELIERTLARVASTHNLSKSRKTNEKIQSSNPIQEPVTVKNEEKIISLRSSSLRSKRFSCRKQESQIIKLESEKKIVKLQNLNQKKIPKGWKRKTRGIINQPALKKHNKVQEENIQIKTIDLEGKDNIYKSEVDSNSKKNKRPSLKPYVQLKNNDIENEDNTPLSDEVPLAKLKCSTLESKTRTKMDIKSRKFLKSLQLKMREKMSKSNKSCKTAKTAKNIHGKPLHRQPLKINRKKSLLNNSEAYIGSSSVVANHKIRDEEILEDRQVNSSNSSSKIFSNGQVKSEEQLKAIPRVVLQDCRKVGSVISNEKPVIKNKFQQKNNLSLKHESRTLNMTDNQETVDSADYFGQLELSALPTSPASNRKPLIDLTLSKKKFGRSEALQISETVTIDDDDEDNDLNTSTLASSPAQGHDRQEKCSYGSSQKKGSMKNLQFSATPKCSNVNLLLRGLTSSSGRKSGDENLLKSSSSKNIEQGNSLQIDEIVTIDDDEDHINLKTSAVSSLTTQGFVGMKQCSVSSSQTKGSVKNLPSSLSSIKQCLPTKTITKTLPFSTQGESSRVFQLQCKSRSYHFVIPDSVQQSDSFIVSRLKDYLLKEDLLPNQQSQPGNQKNPFGITKHSVNNIVASKYVNNSFVPLSSSFKKDIPPAMPVEILAKVDQSLKIPPNITFPAQALSQQSISIASGSSGLAPVFSPKPIPVASGSKNYYFTPLFVLDGEKIVPLNEENAAKYTIRSSEDSNNQLKSAVITSQIVIDSNTIKPLPKLDFSTVSSVVTSPITSAKFELVSANPSLSVVNKIIQDSSGSFTMSSTHSPRKDLKHPTKRKQACLNEADSETELNQLAHRSSSLYSDTESDHLYCAKRKKFEAPAVTKLISSYQGSNDQLELLAKREQTCSIKAKSQNELHQDSHCSSSTHTNLEPDNLSDPKRRRKLAPPDLIHQSNDIVSSSILCDPNLTSRSGSKSYKESSTNLNKQSNNSVDGDAQQKQINSKKKDQKVVCKRVKGKDEELEDCLDGVPPFIREVFKCENIRDGFDYKDLIFVLSLLSDIEEMTSTQRVIFQSKTVKIINDVFKFP